jgi:hypothetical protein
VFREIETETQQIKIAALKLIAAIIKKSGLIKSILDL